MPTYTVPTRDLFSRLEDIMENYHPDLVKHEVKVGLLTWHPSEGSEEPMKLHGYPAAAVVKITPYRQRVQGIADAVITIDGPVWNTLSDAEQDALLDHECHHLELALDEEGNVKADDAGRPKLKMRMHDWFLGGFQVIAERHKAAALEVQGFRNAYKDFYQQVFAWGDDMGGEREYVNPANLLSGAAK